MAIVPYYYTTFVFGGVFPLPSCKMVYYSLHPRVPPKRWCYWSSSGWGGLTIGASCLLLPPGNRASATDSPRGYRHGILRKLVVEGGVKSVTQNTIQGSQDGPGTCLGKLELLKTRKGLLGRSEGVFSRRMMRGKRHK